MSIRGKFDGITSEDLLLEADRFGVRRPKDLLAEVRAAIESWPKFAQEARLTASTAAQVQGDFRLIETSIMLETQPFVLLPAIDSSLAPVQKSPWRIRKI